MKRRNESHVTTLIDAHFALKTSPDDELRLRAHLAVCLACTAYYERALVVSQLTPRSPSAKDRMRAALALPNPRRAAWRWTAAGSALALGATVWMLWLMPAPPRREGLPGWTERGGPETAALSVYEVSRDDERQPLGPGATVTPASELTAAYHAPAGFSYVMIFAVDAQQQMYWYEPAWTNADETPSARPLEGDRTYAMPDGVVHAFAPGPVQLVAAFLTRRLNVREVESAYHHGSLRELDPRARVLIHNLKVEPARAKP